MATTSDKGLATPDKSAAAPAGKKGTNGGSPLTALLLVVPGIALYVYIVYILISMLVYPASFHPFTKSAHPVTTEKYSIGLSHPLVWDGLLLILFAVQHSVMACDGLKGLFEDIGVPVLSRPVYICCTCFTINVIYYCWLPHSSSLWQLDNSIVVLLLLATHLLSWISIACSVFTIDYLELIGIKQIYYSYYGFDNPMTYKSEEQQELLAHNRHPIFLAPTMILWAVPVMSYDRLLVAVMLPLYVALTSNVDTLDRSYVTDQYIMKKQQLLKNGFKECME